MDLHFYFNPEDGAADLATFAKRLEPTVRRAINESPSAVSDRRIPTGMLLVVIDGEA